MEHQVQVEHVAAVPVLVLARDIEMTQIGPFLGEAFGSVAAALGAAGVAPLGGPIARYDMHGTTMTVEAGFPVPPGTGDLGNAVATALPAGEVAVTMHQGPFDQIPQAYRAVSTWMAENGYVPVERPWEQYLDGPDVAMPRTIVRWPCAAVPAE
jgi:effector-binding domain-containing protein